MKMNNIALEKIISESKNIDTDKISNEILDWLIHNVENFIDNQSKIFKIDLIIDGESIPPMPETKKLNDLFKKIPDDDILINSNNVFDKNGIIDMKKLNTKSMNQASKTRTILNEITQECFIKLQKNKEKLKKLYERMIFYYEMVGFYKGNSLIREITGDVNIIKFEYEAFSVNVGVKSPTYKIQKENGIVDTINSNAKEYIIPEGFTIWIEIAFSTKMITNSIF